MKISIVRMMASAALLAGFSAQPEAQAMAADAKAADNAHRTEVDVVVRDKFEGVSDAEIEAVELPLGLYLQGQATDQGVYFRQAFYKDARIIGYSASSSKFVDLSVEEFAGNFAGKDPEDPTTHKRSFKVLEITGTVAIGRVSSDLPKSRYVDYMSLQKIDGVWKIVNKSFYETLK